MPGEATTTTTTTETDTAGDKAQGGTSTEHWSSSFTDAELKDFVSTKGFENAESLANSYRNLEKLRGVSEDKLMKLPQDATDKEAMASIYDKLGRPKDPKEYMLRPDLEEGKELPEHDAKFFEWAETTFHELGLNRSQAESLVKSFNDFAASSDSAAVEAQKLNFEKQDNELKKEWGQAYDQNTDVAKLAAKKFGLDTETVDKLEAVMGYGGVMKFMHKIGAGLGEHSFVEGSGGDGKFTNTPQQAQAKIASKKNDDDFMRRFAAGEAAATQEWKDLHAQAYPPPEEK